MSKTGAGEVKLLPCGWACLCPSSAFAEGFGRNRPGPGTGINTDILHGRIDRQGVDLADALGLWTEVDDDRGGRNYLECIVPYPDSCEEQDDCYGR